MAADASSEADSAGLGPGQIVLIVGPSGAGKDAILREVHRRLADPCQFLFARRVITRAPSRAEDHDCISAAQFAARQRQGQFALSWQAHGLSYGIPIEIEAAIGAGKCVLCNASRTIVARARRRYRTPAVVLIDAPVELRASRLANRCREQDADLAARLARVTDFEAAEADLIIENTGALAVAATVLIDWLLAWRQRLPRR